MDTQSLFEPLVSDYLEETKVLAIDDKNKELYMFGAAINVAGENHIKFVLFNIIPKYSSKGVMLQFEKEDTMLLDEFFEMYYKEDEYFVTSDLLFAEEKLMSI